MAEQHDDHIWLTVMGEAWAIRTIEGGNTFHLWRGYEPDLEYLTVVMMEPDWAERYAKVAASWLEDED